ncbi:hypothetical protein [Methanoregula sp.]|uniref:hypothetical protein n=1 Tax=Methanoregula sp. TaxID=2052170 RepID=UPI00356344EA
MRQLKFFAAMLFIVVIFCISAASAGEVTLSTPQSGYYVLAGEEAVIPVTIVSTYDHDITGTLKQTEIPVNSGNTGSRVASVQTRAFSAFTEQRTVSLPVGRSDMPADYLVTISFDYPESGRRSSTLDGIIVHFVTSIEDAPKNQESLVSSDTENPVSGTSSAGSAPSEKPQAQSPETKLQNNQMSQDTSALRNQLAGKSNQSENEEKENVEDELRGYIVADPLIASINRSLTGAGFALGKTDVSPVSNSSGSFLQTYSSGTKNAIITGTVLGTHVVSAEESSYNPIPLPDALLKNATYFEYGSRIAEKGFIYNQTRINVTPGRQTVALTYVNSQSRMIHVTAVLQNGTVVSVEGDNPDDPLAFAGPAIALACVLLISAGIWYLARIRPKEIHILHAEIPEPEPAESTREIALRLLDEAERDAARGAWPEAYRKTGRALRIFLSHEISRGDELTSRELEQLMGTSSGNTDTIREILNRCLYVGFAKDTPKPGELQQMIGYSRNLLTDGFDGKENQGLKR